MNIENAVKSLLDSESFRDKAKEKNKEGGRLRMFVTRYQRGEVSTGSAVQLLENFGYQIEVKQKPKT
jgi:hypothetical protein